MRRFWTWLITPSLSPLEMYAMLGAYLIIKSVNL